jgi:hypothetical protein
MKILLTVLIPILILNPVASQQLEFDKYLKLSAGKVFFGTGDIPGFFIAIEASKNIIKKPQAFLNRLVIGGEFSFENGVNNPVIENPTQEEFLQKIFDHNSTSVLTAKLSYYPFGSFLRGFNIAIGPSFGYLFHSFEKRAELVSYSPTEFRRMSELGFDNRFIFGYLVSAGFEYDIFKKFLLGFRLDFSSYNNGDINTMIGGKFGYRF